VILAIAPGVARADDVRVDFDSVAHIAVARNRDLVAARHAVAVAEARLRRSGRLDNPEIEAEIRAGRNSEGSVSVGFVQRFPVTSKLRLQRSIAGIDVEIARLEIEEQERKLRLEARTNFVEHVALRESRDLARERSGAARRFSEALASAFGQGLASSLEVEQATIAATTASLEVDARDADWEMNPLTSILSVSSMTTLGTPERLELPSALPSKVAGSAIRPDMRLAEIKVRSRTLEVSLSRASRWDDPTVGVFVEAERSEDAPEGIEREGFAGVRVSIPLPLYQRASSRISESIAARDQAVDEFAALQLRIDREVSTTFRAMQIQFRSAHRATNDLLEPARAHLASTESAHQRGEAELQSVFRARETLADAESAALEAKQSYFLTLAKWLAAIGK
jgi:cobalt-zinc-cadmium efflux system outer membrane protein